MPIKEIYSYIQANREKYSPEELLSSLRSMGYSDGDIQAALTMIENLEAKGKEKHEPKETLPTLYDILFKREEGDNAAVPPLAPSFIKTDFTPVKKKGEFWLGILIPPGIYFLTIITFIFLELFYPLPEQAKWTLFPLSILISSIVFSFFYNQVETQRGISYGILLLVIWGSLGFLLYFYGYEFSLSVRNQ